MNKDEMIPLLQKEIGLSSSFRFHFSFIPSSPLIVEKNNHDVRVTYGQEVEKYRALSLIKEHEKEVRFSLSETPRFRHDGVMLDCSRNGVMKPAQVFAFLRIMALMGLDRLLLYTEDTFALEGYPYFGWGRGAYQKSDLKAIDEYALLLGIEVVPCIETLGHMDNVLWWTAMADYKDCAGVLLSDEDKTYALIEQEIKTCRECFHSSTIHIGMDEAFMLGFGAHFAKHGYVDPKALFMSHLEKVKGICKRYSFDPLIWSDMIFRLTHQGDYYGQEPLDPALVKKMPSDVGLVYWDYYHESEADYEFYLSEHLEFANPISFAGGSWRWTGFTPMVAMSLRRSRYALDACLKKGITDVMLTGWGDNGNEASFFSLFPAMALYAEYSYEGNDRNLDALLRASTGENLDRMLLLDLPNMPDGDPKHLFGNPSKYLFYQDVIGGIFDKHTAENYDENYRQYAEKLHRAAQASPRYHAMYETLADLCSVLEKKANVGVRLRRAYQAGDDLALKRLAEEDLPQIESRVRSFRAALFQQWYEENKSQGFDVLDGRIGWLLARISTAEERLKAYLADHQKTIDELAEEPLYVDGRKEKGETEIMTWNWWEKTASVNPI
jgi:hexosaminidase